ncbi:MAG: class I SAM-dependent methyltransferase [Armatimonadota bacterium]
MRLRPGELVLDVGSGGWFFAEALAAVCRCQVLCVDLRHPEAVPPVPWVCADAGALPLRDGTVHGVFASHLLHHLRDPSFFMRESLRVLRRGGYVGIRCASHGQIRARLVSRLFPEVAERACLTAMDAPAIASALEACGFVDVRSEDVVEPAAPTLAAVLESVKSGAIPGSVPVRADDVLSAVQYLEKRIASEGPDVREDEKLTFITGRKL